MTADAAAVAKRAQGYADNAARAVVRFHKARRDYAAETRALDAHADEPKAIVYLLHRKTHMIATIILQKGQLSAHKERVKPWAFHSNKARKCGDAAKAPGAEPGGRMRILVLKYQG